MSALDRRLDRLAVVYRDDEAPRPETCPGCGRSVPILLTRRYLIVRDAAGAGS